MRPSVSGSGAVISQSETFARSSNMEMLLNMLSSVRPSIAAWKQH